MIGLGWICWFLRVSNKPLLQRLQCLSPNHTFFSAGWQIISCTMWVSWRRTLPANELFVQHKVHAINKVNITAPHHGPFVRHHTITDVIDSQRTSNVESVSMSWPRHAAASYLATQFILMCANKDALSEPDRYANYCKTKRSEPDSAQSPAYMKMLDDTKGMGLNIKMNAYTNI